MTVVLQRVLHASVSVDGQVCGSCEKGMLLLVGVCREDTDADALLLAEKIARLRIFEDENQKMNLSLSQIGGGVLAVSNFTLCADYRRGNRPDFFGAMPPDRARALYTYFCDVLGEQLGQSVARGVFGADMKIDACCDGPVTLTLDSRVLRRERTP